MTGVYLRLFVTVSDSEMAEKKSERDPPKSSGSSDLVDTNPFVPETLESLGAKFNAMGTKFNEMMSMLTKHDKLIDYLMSNPKKRKSSADVSSPVRETSRSRRNTDPSVDIVTGQTPLKPLEPVARSTMVPQFDPVTNVPDESAVISFLSDHESWSKLEFGVPGINAELRILKDRHMDWDFYKKRTPCFVLAKSYQLSVDDACEFELYLRKKAPYEIHIGFEREFLDLVHEFREMGGKSAEQFLACKIAGNFSGITQIANNAKKAKNSRRTMFQLAPGGGGEEGYQPPPSPHGGDAYSNAGGDGDASGSAGGGGGGKRSGSAGGGGGGGGDDSSDDDNDNDDEGFTPKDDNIDRICVSHPHIIQYG